MSLKKIIYLEEQPTCENLMLHFKEILIVHFYNSISLEYLRLNEIPTSYSEWFASDNRF